MGLPQLTFELKKAADTVAARTAQGVIGMIVKDTKSVGVHVIYQESDIEREFFTRLVKMGIHVKIESNREQME